jgi:fatty-acyl-CoA synthase
VPEAVINAYQARGVTFMQGDGLTEASPGVLFLYWRSPAQTAEILTEDGWLRTGDIGIADHEGFITIRDRTKDLIISGGENIYPAEVEDALYQHPAVAECAVIGVPDPHWGEVGLALVVPRDGTTPDPAQLLGFLAGRIAKYRIPKSVVFTDSLPRTASGKVLKSELRDRYASTERNRRADCRQWN